MKKISKEMLVIVVLTLLNLILFTGMCGMLLLVKKYHAQQNEETYVSASSLDISAVEAKITEPDGDISSISALDFEHSEQNKNDEIALIIQSAKDEVLSALDSLAKEQSRTSRTYEKLLEEMKKKNIASVENDSVLAALITEGNKNFSEKKYSASYQNFRNALSYDNDNIDVRMKKALSLYYSNPMDNTKYKELLEDCIIIERAGLFDSRIDDMKKKILLETGEQ